MPARVTQRHALQRCNTPIDVYASTQLSYQICFASCTYNNSMRRRNMPYVSMHTLQLIAMQPSMLSQNTQLFHTNMLCVMQHNNRCVLTTHQFMFSQHARCSHNTLCVIVMFGNFCVKLLLLKTVLNSCLRYCHY